MDVPNAGKGIHPLLYLGFAVVISIRNWRIGKRLLNPKPDDARHLPLHLWKVTLSI